MVVWRLDDKNTELIVASAMGLHDHTDWHPFGGELGWVCSDPAHRGRGLGQAVCAAVTARLIQAGYQHIHLYTEDYRHAAIKTYLRLGYVPYVPTTAMSEQWRKVQSALAEDIRR
jgi:mycothiol synthase